MGELQEKLRGILYKIEEQEEIKRNKIQVEFLKEIANDDFDKDKFLKLLKNTLLIDQLELGEKDIENLQFVIKELETNGANENKNSQPIDPKKNIRYYRTEYENYRIEIFLKKPKGYTMPTEIYEFISAVEDIQTVIKENCKSNEEADKYLSTLYGIAEVGGTSTYNSFAKKQLDTFEANFVASKWWSLKLPFIKELGVTMFAAVLMCLVLVLLLKIGILQDEFYEKMNIDEGYLTNWFFVLIGSLLGTWVSFSLFKRNKTIEEIKSLRDNIPHPLYRLAIVALVSSIFYLFFITGFFNVEIGSGDLLSTKNIGTKNFENLALLVGVFIGFSENSVGQSLRKRIESFTSKL
ncbi:hypothetical protein [Aquimarina sp. SS2-1]|uniref:hypothetical protein n=1 Tax=Aquimarina besae TaxID=3342247 RepID=UPI00367098E8